MDNPLKKIQEMLAKFMLHDHDWTSKCNASVHSMNDLVHRGNLLNQRQCEDLTTKFTSINKNIDLLLGWTREFWISHSSMKNFYRCLEKAKMLVTSCGERDWWHAAAFQWGNEYAFQEILLDASLCYNVIYDNVRSSNESWGRHNFNGKIIQDNDLQQSEVFEPASASDVQKDNEDLTLLLIQLVYDPESIQSLHCPCPKDLTIAQSLANYLLLKMGSLEQSNDIMWENHSEQPGTWGCAPYLGGTGASGVVAITWLGIPCFKKEFHAIGEGHEKAFLNEAAIITHVKHPHIIRSLCCGNGQDTGCRFIAMELMDKSLFKLIEDRKGEPFLIEVILDIFVQIARGMCYLHDQGIAHRDLKPQNVVVNEMTSPHLQGYYNVKLIDFGTSKTEVEVAKSSTITFFGVGTSMYRAPELHPKAKADSKRRAKWFNADVFSFAMTCVHVLQLREPFKDMEYLNSDDLYNKVMNGARPRLTKDCPQILCDLLNDCWNIVPSRRPTFADIYSRLETFRLITLTNKSIKDYQGQGLPSSLEFIKTKIEAQSSIYKQFPKVVLDRTNDEEEFKSSDLVTIISCTCNRELTYLQQSPYHHRNIITCDMCGQRINDGELYHCSTCQFDAHPHCAQIREKVDVSFHEHSLQLLTQNYYKNNPEVVCFLCEESLQYREWVYRCEQCEYDVHATCTKLPNCARCKLHEHPLFMRSCPPRKSLVCGHCNGNILERTWHYHCGPCGFSVHLLCAICPANPLCPFDNSHELTLDINSKILECTFCGIQGNSQLYYCDQCNFHTHRCCVDYIDINVYNWNEDYAKVMMEKDKKDVYIQATLILDLLDKLPLSHASRARSSTLRPPSVMNVQPLAQPQANLLRMLENLEEVESNLHNLGDASKDEKEFLKATYEKLKKKKQLVKEEIAIQEESKIYAGPRIVVFFKDVVKNGRVTRELLTHLQSSMKDVRFALLCEEPGHEHIVQGKIGKFNNELGKELTKKLEPLLPYGLHIVRNSILSTGRENELVRLKSITMPNLEASVLWDLRAVDLSKGIEYMEVLKQAANSSAEWFQRWNEIRGFNIRETYGLHRIRYIVGEEGNHPCYKQGSLAWLCGDHFNAGLQEGMLESFSSKYHNIEDDYEIRYPPHLRVVE